MYYRLLALIFLIPTALCAQMTWSSDIAEIVYSKCTACHNDNGIAPFSLMEHDLVTAVAFSIHDAVSSDYMPPWTADDSYQSYAHSRALSPTQKANILGWIDDGMPLGNAEEVPPPPVYTNQGFIQAPPDLELIMDMYTSTATFADDDYICVSMPSGLLEDKVLKAFEVVPGNPSILHHCLVYIDDSGNYPSNFGGNCTGPNNDEGLIGGYTPGSVPTVFPSNGEDINMGVTIPAGSNIVFAMHYPHGSAGEVDQTKIRMYFYDQEVEVREVTTYPLLENWNFFVQPNTVQDVAASLNNITEDISILSVFPHMHLVGDYIKAYALDPDNDTIPLIRINNWDFEWQEFYFLEQIQVIPAGSDLRSEGAYDNTSSNLSNPNSPPLGIGPGLNTTDEMFLVYFHYLPYVDGDEDIDLSELTQYPVGLSELELAENSFLAVYPNPSAGLVTFDFDLKNSVNASLFIYNTQGELVEKIIENIQVPVGTYRGTWDSQNVAPGVYFYSLMLEGKNYSGKIAVK
jgi:hypothetical protein